MTDLPQQSNSQADETLPLPPSSPPPSFSASGKEAEGMHIVSPELPLKAVGQEVLLPKEVAAEGVHIHPTTVPLPPQMQQLGVQSVGANVPVRVSNGNAVTLPLTDEQIAAALHQSVTSSIRWLAEWCTRKIKMMHEKIATKNNQSPITNQQ